MIYRIIEKFTMLFEEKFCNVYLTNLLEGGSKGSVNVHFSGAEYNGKQMILCEVYDTKKEYASRKERNSFRFCVMTDSIKEVFVADDIEMFKNVKVERGEGVPDVNKSLETLDEILKKSGRNYLEYTDGHPDEQEKEIGLIMSFGKNKVGCNLNTFFKDGIMVNSFKAKEEKHYIKRDIDESFGELGDCALDIFTYISEWVTNAQIQVDGNTLSEALDYDSAAETIEDSPAEGGGQ